MSHNPISISVLEAHLCESANILRSPVDAADFKTYIFPLLYAVHHVKEQHGDVKRLWGKLYGLEKNLATSSIARMNLFHNGSR